MPATPTYSLDHNQLDPFLARLIAVASGQAGVFVACGLGEALAPVTHPVENDKDALANLVAAFEAINKKPGINAYVSIGLFKPCREWTNPRGKGAEADAIGSLAFVGDFDALHGNTAAEVAKLSPLTPEYVVETSAGSYQAWVFLDRPYVVAEAKPVFQALTRALGSDKTFSCEHLFRPPGTWNWPTKKKIEDGRSPEPQLARVVGGPVLW